MGTRRTPLIFLRSILFLVGFYLNFALLACILPACLIIRFQAIVRYIGKMWNRINVKMLWLICGVKYNIEGVENISKESMLILFRHESTWETYFLYQYFKTPPVAIAKRELLYIPIFGYMVKGAGNIFIDRKAGVSSIKDIVKQAKKLVKNGRSIMIAPQGTRVPIGRTSEEYPYKSGFCAVLDACDLPILPVVLDSGKAWPKGSFLKYPCTINVKFLPPIPREQTKNMDRREIVDMVEKIMEDERKKMQ
jgi:1-acyl-sn-glycerol-3-phosphate acyltransferase